MRQFLLPALVAVLVAPTAALSQMSLFGATGEKPQAKETIETSSTMAGGQSFMTETDRLFAAIQLLHGQGKDQQIQVRQDLHYPSFWLPVQVRTDEYKICVDIRTRNDSYRAEFPISLKDLSADAEQNAQVVLDSWPYEPDEAHADQPVGPFSTDDLLPHAIVAQDCDALQSGYYVPASWSKDAPDTLEVVLEVVTSAIDVSLVALRTSDAPVDTTPKIMDCVVSKRVPGYDCTIALAKLGTHTHFELVVSAEKTQNSDPDVTKARLTVPERMRSE